MDKNPLEDDGTSLLEQWSQGEPSARKIQIAPDVELGDAVYLSSETGRYEKVTTDSPFHGIFRDNAVIIPVTINSGEAFIRHSLIDGQMSPGVWKMDEE